MNQRLSLFVAKATSQMSRRLGKGSGQALPGLMIERLRPHLVEALADQLPHGVILITGTNGKTTTTKLIAKALEASGEKVLVNLTGSNLYRGIVSALVSEADYAGHIKATIGLFEVDEASLRQVARKLQPRHIVVLNLFRDQLDRYGELDTTAAMIGEGIAATKAHVYLNADDPLVASLAKYAFDRNAVTYFGIEGLPTPKAPGNKTAADSDRCPICHKLLIFSRVFYGHIGHYRCPEGHFNRPQPHVSITNVDRADLQGTEFTLATEGRRLTVSFPLPGTYNLYNALAALTLLGGVGVAQDVAAGSIARAEPAFGRVEQVSIDGKTLYLLLVKNPAGFSQLIETFLLDKQSPNILMAINDLDADGRDVSWLWDVPVEVLAPYKPRIITAGIRAADMSLRLKYAGVPSEEADLMDKALSMLIESTPPGGTAFILPTYTAMLNIRKLLSKLTHIAEINHG